MTKAIAAMGKEDLDKAVGKARAYLADKGTLDGFKPPARRMTPKGVIPPVPKALYRYQGITDIVHPDRAWFSAPEAHGYHSLYFGRQLLGQVQSMSPKDRTWARGRQRDVQERMHRAAQREEQMQARQKHIVRMAKKLACTSR